MSLSKYNGNIPLICKVEYAPVTDIDSFVRIGSTEVNISLQQGKSWQEIYATLPSVQLKEKKELTTSGNIYSLDIGFVFPGNNRTAYEQFIALERAPLIVRITYSDGSISIVGNPNEPAFINSDFESAGKTVFNCILRSLSVERFRFETV